MSAPSAGRVCRHQSGGYSILLHAVRIPVPAWSWVQPLSDPGSRYVIPSRRMLSR